MPTFTPEEWVALQKAYDEGDVPPPARYSTADDAIEDAICPVLPDYAYNHRAIFEECFDWFTVVDSNGVQHGGGWFQQTASDAEFWASAYRHGETWLVVADCDLVAAETLKGDGGEISPLYQVWGANPELDAVLQQVEEKIKDALVRYWRREGYEVYDCPDSELFQHIAAGWVNADTIYQPTYEEWEQAWFAAWDDAGVDEETLTNAEEQARELLREMEARENGE